MSDATAMTLRTLAAEIRGLDGAAVRAKYAAAFFLRPAQAGTALAGPNAMTLMGPSTAGHGGGAGDDALFDYWVYPVRRSTSKRFGGDYIAIGRGENNDILLDDASVSKFHAFVVQEGGGLTLADAGSRNGTFLNDQRVVSYRDGKPAPLKDGDRVRVGDVRLTLMFAAALVQLCQRVK